MVSSRDIEEGFRKFENYFSEVYGGSIRKISRKKFASDNPRREIVEMEYSQNGRERRDSFFLKISNLERELRGYMENPGLSAPLVFYDNETSTLSTAIIGQPLYRVLASRGMDSKLLANLGSVIRRLKTVHGDVNLANCIVSEKTYDGPSITTPEKDEQLVFIDYAVLGSNTDYRSKELELFDALTRIARDVPNTHSELVGAYRHVLEGFGVSPQDFLADVKSIFPYDEWKKAFSNGSWMTKTVAGTRDTVLALEDLAMKV